MALAAAPAWPQRDAAAAWETQFTALERDLRKWARRTAAGQPPLTVGEQTRLRGLITSVNQLTGATGRELLLTAGIADHAQTAMRASLEATTAALPPHAVAAANEAALAVGWTNVPNPGALSSVITGEIGQLTGDFGRYAIETQQAIAQAVSQTVALGEAPRDLAKRLTALSDHTFRSGQARSIMIARTTLARAYDLASFTVYDTAAARGLIKGWRWIAHGKNPCDVCLALNGYVFPVGQDTYRHPNCTCQNVPVLDDEPGTADPAGPESLELQTSKTGWTHWVEKPRDTPTPNTQNAPR